MSRGFVLLLLGALASAAPGITNLRAGEATGVIEGHVRSEEGVGVAGATIVISEGRCDVTRVSTGAGGRFRSGYLDPGGGYLLQVDATGYQATRVGPVDVPSGESIHLDVTIAGRTFGQSTEEQPVQVLDTGSSQTSSRFDAGFLDGLPIIGHDYQDALTLAPGVTDPDGDQSPNVHGARQTGLQYRLDGGDVTDPSSAASGIDLNPLVIEEIEIITAGATADHGRAMGGFTDVTTRSGGNDLEWRGALFWRGPFLDGDGAGNDDVVSFDEPAVDYHDFRAAARVGGPFLKDRLWYFAALEVLDEERPSDQIGSGLLVESRGTYHFGKLTWQADSVNKLGVQVVVDPRKTEGLGLTTLTSSDSGYELDRRGRSALIGWTATFSPGVILEAAVTRFDADLEVRPTSPLFEPTRTLLVATPSAGGTGLSALYPCSFRNCSTTLGEKRIYQIDEFTGRVSGPYFQTSDDSRRRDALRADLLYMIERGPGRHRLEAGFELAEEKSGQEVFSNPILFDFTTPYFSFGVPASASEVSGFQVLLTAQPGGLDREVANFSTGIYLMDSWKPRSNIAITAGVRFDRENLDSTGFEEFDPRLERKRSINLWRAVCAEAARQDVAAPFSNCNPLVPYNGAPPNNLGPLRSFLDQDMDGINDVPSLVADLDLNQNGFVDFAGQEGAQLFRYFTTFAGRETRSLGVKDSHISPRIGISWDPWDDGKTRLFAHWGRYYDRLLSETVLPDSEPSLMAFTFIPNSTTHAIAPGSVSNAGAFPSISQVEHGLHAPRTDELSLGFERSLGAAWSVGATYIRRKARDLLQDTDLNHYTCAQAWTVIGIDPNAICGYAGALVEDRFGQIVFSGTGTFFVPNGVEDLYSASNSFNQVLRVDNVNSSDYVAYELNAVHGLHHGWQMQASYTYSRARGQAEEFLSALGDDPSTISNEEGYLDYDQRHRVRLEAVTRLPHGLALGGLITWTSGTPYSVITPVTDADSSNNLVSRTLYPTGRRNDHRNDSAWLLDGRIEKSFRIGRLNAAGFLNVENLLNTDTLVISSISADGTRLVATRDFGRRFEIGGIFGF